MHVHLIGVAGTGMGSLAVLFRSAGHRVSGSDVRFDPPMGDVLRTAGVECKEGYSAENLAPAIDLVVVGNVIRKDNAEAVAAETRGLRRSSMSLALREQFLLRRKPLVVAGTHGKTTTSSMCAWALYEAGLEPGYFIGGVSKSLPDSAALGRRGSTLHASSRSAGASPFVVEGDEYDAVYWHKEPKFLDYIGIGEDDVAIVTSVEHDHIDIYPTEAAYTATFAELARRVPRSGLLVTHAADARAVAASRESTARLAYYALAGDDTGDANPAWVGAPVAVDDQGRQPFDLYAGGMSCGRFVLSVPGHHNVRNAVATIAACAEGFDVKIPDLRASLATFAGVRRRQDLLSDADGVHLYDDFAHHPTAVDETLRALRSKHPTGRLWAVFEPRSATACRSLHQAAYARAFTAASHVILAPLGRTGLPTEDTLDLERLAKDLGPKAIVAPSAGAIVERLAREAGPGDTVAILSNGAFGGVPKRLVEAFEERSRVAERDGRAHDGSQ
jgi:UDP-N-acetylmuramate: L-alanyl-gamma-D-glutamyl-meso-diaminopimelate ligase